MIRLGSRRETGFSDEDRRLQRLALKPDIVDDRAAQSQSSKLTWEAWAIVLILFVAFALGTYRVLVLTGVIS